MRKGILEFPRPEVCSRKFIRAMTAKQFELTKTIQPVEKEEAAL
jgi:hypothetical protein